MPSMDNRVPSVDEACANSVPLPPAGERGPGTWWLKVIIAADGSITTKLVSVD